MIWIILLGILAALIWYTGVKPMRYWQDKGVKQIRPWPFLGNSYQFLLGKMSMVEWVEWIYNVYPNARYVGGYQFTCPALLLRDPELIKQITVKDFDHFTDHRTFIDPEADPLWGGNLFTLKGQKWREMRATLSGSFTSSKMKNMFHLMEETAENFVQYFLDKNEDIIEVELKDTFTRYTNDVIATAAFGIKCDSLTQPNNEFYLMGKTVTNFTSLKNTIKYFGYMLMPALFKFFKIGMFEKNVEAYFRSIINETIRVREEQGIIRQDMIHLLLEAKKGIKNEEKEVIETGFATVKESADIGKFRQIKNLTNEDITAQALIFFFAGFDTISTAMCFGSYELAINKDIQDKLREEIRETYGINNGKVTYDVLLKMRYMDMVISEILRKWPPSIVLDRIATKPYTIEPVLADEKSLHLKLGDVIIVPVQGIHRDSANYPNPEKFDPERFSDENKKLIKPYTYLPFGTGPRGCIGSRFALLEIKALMFKLLLNFELLPSKKTQIPLKIDKKSLLQYTVEGGFWFALKRISN